MAAKIQSAEDELKGYGYTEGVDGLLVRGNGEAWKREGDGFVQFRPMTQDVVPAIGVADPSGGQPWGIPAPGVPGWMQVPYEPLEKWRTVSGIHPMTHPECFQWLWPEDVVAEKYHYAYREGGKAWKRIEHEDGSTSIVEDEDAA